MFEVMESKVLAILLSTFLVLAFITEKASGIIATVLVSLVKGIREKTER